MGAFGAALTFLTRLPWPGDPGPLGRAVACFGLVGCVIGLLATLPVLVLYAVFASVPSAAPVAALTGGWLWVAQEGWWSRGLHWDGLADVGDGLGSGARGERFWEILKDSRLGSFGALILFLTCALQASAVALHLTATPTWLFPLLPLTLAPGWARLICIDVAKRSISGRCHGLGGAFCAQVGWPQWLWAMGQCAAMLTLCHWWGVPGYALALLISIQAATNHWILGTAARRGGISGDFLGCHIEISQMWFLLATALPA